MRANLWDPLGELGIAVHHRRAMNGFGVGGHLKILRVAGVNTHEAPQRGGNVGLTLDEAIEGLPPFCDCLAWRIATPRNCSVR